MNTLKKVVVAAWFAVMAASGSIAQAGTMEGVLQGYGCAVIQKLCVVDRMDPRLAAENNFVIVDTSGTPYFITNIDSSVLAGNVLNQVRISGDINNKYKTIEADKLEYLKNGQWHELWSIKMQRQMQKEEREILYWGT